MNETTEYKDGFVIIRRNYEINGETYSTLIMYGIMEATHD